MKKVLSVLVMLLFAVCLFGCENGGKTSSTTIKLGSSGSLCEVLYGWGGDCLPV